MKYLTLILIVFSSMSYGQNFTMAPKPEGELVYTCPPCGCDHDDGHFDAMGSCPSCNMALQPEFPGVASELPPYRRLTAGMLIFDHADIMDVTGPWSVLVHNGVQVVSFAKSKDPVTIGMSMELTPDFTLDNLPDVDILIFPGSGMAETNPGDEAIQQFIKARATTTDVLFSVCSGAFFLAESGLLDGKVATTFASLIPRLEEQYPEIEVVNNVKYTDNGNIVTTAGLSSGIDGAFHVVSKFRGQGGVQDVANHMEYAWSRSTDYARSQLADHYIMGVKGIVGLFSKAFLLSGGDRDQWTYQYLLSGQVSSEQVLKVIQKELEKTGRWLLETATPDSVVGTFDHDIMGPGLISLDVLTTEEGDVLTIAARRLEKYAVPVE